MGSPGSLGSAFSDLLKGVSMAPKAWTEIPGSLSTDQKIYGAFMGAPFLAAGAGSMMGAAPAAQAAPIASTAPTAGGAPMLSAGPLATAAPAAGTATPGTTAAMYETLGATAPAATPGTTGAMYSSIGATAPAAAPGGIDAAMVAGGAGKTGGFWSGLKNMNPAYASAGASILSNLFSGLMQMEQQKEEQERQRQMALAKSKIERANAQNAALDRLINVWQGAKR